MSQTETTAAPAGPRLLSRRKPARGWTCTSGTLKRPTPHARSRQAPKEAF